MTYEPNKPPKARRTNRQVYRVGEIPDDLLAAIAASEPGPECEAVERELAQVSIDEANEAEARRRAEVDTLIGRIAKFDNSIGLDD